MKNSGILAAVATAFCLAGCAKTDCPSTTNNLVDVFISAGTGIKTSLASDNSVQWSVGDQISVSLSGGNKYTFTAETVNGSSAVFRGSILESDAADGAHVECAIYPAQNPFDIWWTKARNLPIMATQRFVEGGFAPETNTSFAWADAPFVDESGKNLCLNFKNMAGLISVNVKSSIPIRSIQVMGNSNEEMSGTFNIDAYEGVYESSISTNSSVTLAPESGTMDFSSGKQCVFVVKANSFSSGVTVMAENESGQKASMCISVPFDLGMGKKAVLPDIEFTAEDFHAPITERVNLAGTYTLLESTNSCAYWFKARSGANQMGSEIKSAEGDSRANGRKYKINYNGYTDMDLFFNLSDIPMPGHDNCFKLSDFQDRQGADPIPSAYNYSYYDANSGKVVFDFAICGYWSTSTYNYTLYKEDPAFPSGIDITGSYTATPQETGAFGGRYYKWVEKDPSAETLIDKTYQLNGLFRNMAGEVTLAGGASANGQKYKVCYSDLWTDGILFFDVLPLAAEGHPGCWTLGNFQDRASGGDIISGNNSFYNPSNGSLVFDFVIDNNNTVYEISAILSK